MPLLVKSEDFTETTQRVFVSVPLNGVSASKADIYANDAYIKINFPPFFYEADLAHLIDPDDSEAIVGNGCVKFSLKKVHEELWTSLRPSNINAIDLKSRRLEAEARELKRVEEQKRNKAIKKREEHYKLIQEQLNVERAEKARVENLKIEEKRAAEEAIQTWKASLTQPETTATTHAVKKLDSGIFDLPPESKAESDDSDEDCINMDEIRAKVRKQLDS
ncbi:Dynein assembly factor 4, axonemal [Entophlyctis luteolus]|nr:Dynein assembly factor 4, axonemal [Entophlyctis luteolus]